jgi:hypothetical protein
MTLKICADFPDEDRKAALTRWTTSRLVPARMISKAPSSTG